jgi:hypothetical protein
VSFQNSKVRILGDYVAIFPPLWGRETTWPK